MKLQNHLLQKDRIEDWLRDQGFLVHTMPTNWEMLFRRKDAFLGPMMHERCILKELPAVFRWACCSISHLLPESVSTAQYHLTSNPQEQVGSVSEQPGAQATHQPPNIYIQGPKQFRWLKDLKRTQSTNAMVIWPLQRTATSSQPLHILTELKHKKMTLNPIL